MSNVTNLNKFRKAKTKSDRRRKADENAVRFGQSKADKAQQLARAEKLRRELDGHKRDECSDTAAGNTPERPPEA